MLSGEYRHTIDAKGRLFMPVKLREVLGDSFVLTRGLDRNLFTFSMEEWEKFANKLRSLPISDVRSQQFARIFLSSVQECQTDKQGRFVVPQNLRKLARLDKDAVIIGMLDRVEIWDAGNWDAYIEEFDEPGSENFREMLQSVQQFGI